MKEKFYEKTWFTILTLICVFPVGLILMWKNKKFNIPTRIVITILGVFIIFCIMGGSKGSTENNNTKQTIAITTTEANVNLKLLQLNRIHLLKLMKYQDKPRMMQKILMMEKQ
jgi:apolipoprotein N-acyltransferase